MGAVIYYILEILIFYIMANFIFFKPAEAAWQFFKKNNKTSLISVRIISVLLLLNAMVNFIKLLTFLNKV
jgi:hypothetical protein